MSTPLNGQENKDIIKKEEPTQIKLIKDKLEYSINLAIIEKEKEKELKIEIKLLNSMEIFSYIGEFKLSDMIKLCNFFKSFNDIKELKNLIIEGHSKNKLLISKNENKNELILTLNFFSGYEEKKIDFILSRKLLDKEDIIQLLVEKIVILEKENKETNIKFNQLNIDYKQLKNEFDTIKNWKNKYEHNFEELLEIKKNQEALKQIDSKIIKTKEELKLIDDRIKNNDPILKKKKINYNLLYRGTRDGDKVSTFHSKCNNKSPTLSIIKTKKGMRFGGYTEQTWNDANGSGIWKKDDKAFCFSIELNKIYNIIKGRDAIHCGPLYMCYFGGNIFGLYDGAFSRDNWCYSKDQSNSYQGQEKDFELTHEENNKFYLAEVEVFEIIYE